MNNPRELEQKRQAVLQRLRERRYESRHTTEVDSLRPEVAKLVQSTQGPQTKIELLRRYLEVKNSRPKKEKSNQGGGMLIENPFTSVMTNLAEGEVPSSSENQEKLTPSQTILEQLGGKEFLKHIHTWLYSADTTFSPSSSTLEEIEQYRKEVLYRQSMLKVMLEATQKELEGIEVHVRAVKAIENISSHEE